MFLNDYPYTDFHEMNLDWILKTLKAVVAQMENFIAANSLTFADPLQHDITKTYLKNTIVIDEHGNAYLSLKPVPSGIELNNAEYWLLIFNFHDYVMTANKNLSDHYEYDTERATVSLSIGDWLVWNDVLYKVIAAIVPDDLYDIGVNIEHFTIEDFIKDFMTSIENDWAAYKLQLNGEWDQFKLDYDQDFNIFTNSINGIVNQNLQDMQDEVDRILAGATVDSEVIDARLQANNVTYSTLGNGIRSVGSAILLSIIDSGMFSINMLPETQGWMKGDKTWNEINNNYKHSVIPVNPGDLITINFTGWPQAECAFLKTYTKPDLGDSVDYSDEVGYDDRFFPLSPSVDHNYTVPSDAKYMVISRVVNGNRLSFFKFNINERVINTTPEANSFLYHGNIADLGYTAFSDAIENGYYRFNLATANLMSDKPSTLADGGTLVTFKNTTILNAISQFLFDSHGNIWFRFNTGSFVNISSINDDLTYKGKYSSLGYTTFRQPTEAGYYNFGASDLPNLTDAPNDLAAGGFVTVYSKVGAADHTCWIITDVYGNQWISLGGDFRKFSQGYDTRSTWYALGDSITVGYYSSGGVVAGVTDDNYVNVAAKINGYKVTNYGDGSMGYVNLGTNTNKNAMQRSAEINFSGCNLVTLAFGLNDWHYDVADPGDIDTSTLGDGTVVGNMRQTIENILDSNPECKIVVLLPINQSKYGGTFNSNYGLGLDLYGRGTLQDYIDAEISVCDFYGIQYVELAKVSQINRYNLTDLLSDGAHPIEAAYTPLGHAVAGHINFA